MVINLLIINIEFFFYYQGLLQFKRQRNKIYKFCDVYCVLKNGLILVYLVDQKNFYWRYRELQLIEIKVYVLDDKIYKLYMYFNSEKLEKVNIYVFI